ncbi:hypothetical protein BdWA1_002898 [Babesia duncani]|uniref:Uncharacterized protein n=1 Tax=Babesia duncani TaxID=323732 RepID=A0AAD9PIA2_9APIC|nr:hypothetical protein BdWA1_002898 [Babesia duncani]
MREDRDDDKVKFAGSRTADHLSANESPRSLEVIDPLHWLQKRTIPALTFGNMKTLSCVKHLESFLQKEFSPYFIKSYPLWLKYVKSGRDVRFCFEGLGSFNTYDFITCKAYNPYNVTKFLTLLGPNFKNDNIETEAFMISGPLLTVTLQNSQSRNQVLFMFPMNATCAKYKTVRHYTDHNNSSDARSIKSDFETESQVTYEPAQVSEKLLHVLMDISNDCLGLSREECLKIKDQVYSKFTRSRETMYPSGMIDELDRQLNAKRRGASIISVSFDEDIHASAFEDFCFYDLNFNCALNYL